MRSVQNQQPRSDHDMFALRCITSMMALPGMMYLAAAAGAFEFPAQMRMSEKFDFIGIPMTSTLGSAIMFLVGAGKVTIALNNWVIKSTFLDALFANASVPGFALVLYVHRSMPNPEPWSGEVPVLLMPIALCMIWLLAADGQKGKTQ